MYGRNRVSEDEIREGSGDHLLGLGSTEKAPGRCSSVILPDPLPQPTRQSEAYPAFALYSSSSVVKRSAPDDDTAGAEPSAKRRKAEDLSSPSKRRRLEEDGLVMMDSANDKLEDENVIEID
ncbi:hypothetical protein MPER_06287 [Moniliophthora perniciosa FA553]|nr:hypothetical protein MPER_06287 [Moniliophthora perniciosa FA553]